MIRRIAFAILAALALAACVTASDEAVMCDDHSVDCGNDTAPVVLDNSI